MVKTPGSRRPTIVDVAEAAQVSVSTVSRVLRKHQDVSTSTRSRVQEAILSLGYRPSPVARAMVAGESKLIALLVSDITNPFYPQLARSVELEAKREGYTVVICNTEDRTAETRRCMERLIRQGLDGVIHASVARDEKVALSLIEDPSRIVFANRRPTTESVSYVVSDNRAAATSLTEFLLSQGHRRIGFIAGPQWASNAAERLQGFQEVMGSTDAAEPLIAAGAFSVGHGAETALVWMHQLQRPTAIIAVNDSVALGALGAVTELGLRVPDEIALAGFDGVQLAASPIFSLTTMDQQIDEVGRLATQILLRQLSGAGPSSPVQKVLPTRLILRRSTALAPRQTVTNREVEGSALRPVKVAQCLVPEG